MAPGHSLLIRAELDPQHLPSQKHTRTITHSDAHNGLIVISSECTGSLSCRFQGQSHDVGMVLHVPLAHDATSSMQPIDAAAISSS